MIKNEKQYQITKKKIVEFEEATSRYQAFDKNELTELERFQQGALKSQLQDLRTQVMEYESLKSGNLCSAYYGSFKDVSRILIQGRIARGWSQKDLADKIGTKEQQVQRWESDDYESASLQTVVEILDVIGIDVGFGMVSLVRSTFNLPTGIDRQKLADASERIVNRKNLFAHC